MDKHKPPLNHILYVEDDDDIRELVRISLEEVAGYKVDICSSGQQAIDICDKIFPQMVILDVMMPDIDGLAVLKHYRNLPKFKNTPFVFMTAKIQSQEIRQYESLGISGIISKPFDPARLGERVEEIWDEFHEKHAEVPLLHQVNNQYLEKLGFIRQDILQFVMALTDNSFNQADLSTLKILINNLIGSGESFGYKDISSEASILTHELDDVRLTSSDDLDDSAKSRLSALLLALSVVIDRSIKNG